jgi:multicomponent Na+:H+ antiporter subunit D
VAVAEIFAALLTEIGVYALIRLFTLIFVHDIGYTDTVIVTLARFTMMTGVVGAIPRTFLALLTIAIRLGAQAMARSVCAPPSS